MTEFSKDVEAALDRYAAEHSIGRDEALQQLVAIGLRDQGHLAAPEQSIDTDTSETVQYPEFVTDASGGAGG